METTFQNTTGIWVVKEPPSTGNLREVKNLQDEYEMAAALPQKWLLDPSILLPSTRTQAKKAKLADNIQSCNEVEQYWAAKRLVGLVVQKAAEHDIPLDDAKLAKRIVQRVSDIDRANAITAGKKFAMGLAAARKHHSAALEGLEKEFEKGTFDSEVLNTHLPEMKGPYWKFIKTALEAKRVEEAQEECAIAEQQLQTMHQQQAASPTGQDEQMSDADALRLLWTRLTGPFLLSLKSAWFKNHQACTAIVEKGKEMWVDRVDRLTAPQGDAPVDPLYLVPKGQDPLTMAMHNTEFMETLLAHPCCLLCDLDLADFETEHLSKAVAMFGERGIVLVIQTGTHEDQAEMLVREQSILSSLTLAKCARVWLQVNGEEPGPGITAASMQKQVGSVLVLAANKDDNALAKRVFGLYDSYSI